MGQPRVERGVIGCVIGCVRRYIYLRGRVSTCEYGVWVSRGLRGV